MYVVSLRGRAWVGRDRSGEVKIKYAESVERTKSNTPRCTMIHVGISIINLRLAMLVEEQCCGQKCTDRVSKEIAPHCLLHKLVGRFIISGSWQW